MPASICRTSKWEFNLSRSPWPWVQVEDRSVDDAALHTELAAALAAAALALAPRPPPGERPAKRRAALAAGSAGG